MLDYTAEKTDNFISQKLRTQKRPWEKTFTPKHAARFMASLFDCPNQKIIKVLDPGAGSGILSAAIVEEINKHKGTVEKIELTCYETKLDVLPLLAANIDYMKKHSEIPLTVRITTDDYF